MSGFRKNWYFLPNILYCPGVDVRHHAVDILPHPGPASTSLDPGRFSDRQESRLEVIHSALFLLVGCELNSGVNQGY